MLYPTWFPTRPKSTVVRPVLEYASPVWVPHRQTDIKTLNQVQRRAARYVFNDYHTRTPGCVNDMIYELGLESLEDRHYVARHCLLNKIQHGLVDTDSAAYLKPSDSRKRNHTAFFSKSAPTARFTSTSSFQGPSGNGTCYYPQ